ncbi:DUF4252 domain-containing protein [Flavobacterium sp. WC2509]|uniref:DUF4252 domain-containing protein n=1 Tax=Flavobacterium sp. WC2509 TaxID=3461406 RepID=UPI004043C551
MKTVLFLITLLSGLIFGSCSSEPSLQKYFAENIKNKDFVAVDISSDIMNIYLGNLEAGQVEALQSIDTINALVFKLNAKNKSQFEIERAKVNLILKDPKYKMLIEFDSGKQGASVKYVGTEKHINEFVFFANNKDTGFGLVRILGRDLNPKNIINMVSVLKEEGIDFEQLKPLKELNK